MEVFSLSKGFNMTGWRCAAVLGTQRPSRPTGASRQTSTLACSRRCSSPAPPRSPGHAPPEEMNAIYGAAATWSLRALREIGVQVEPPTGTIYVCAGAGGPHLGFLRRARAQRGRPS